MAPMFIVKRLGTWLPAFVLSHVTVLVWKATSATYLPAAKFVEVWVLKPLYPLVVWAIGFILPFAQTFAGNTEPTHEQALHVFIALFLTLYWALLSGMLGAVGNALFPKRSVRRPIPPAR